MPTVIVRKQTEPTERLANVDAVIREYHKALDQRKHGAVACHEAVEKIEEILGLQWRSL